MTGDVVGLGDRQACVAGDEGVLIATSSGTENTAIAGHPGMDVRTHFEITELVYVSMDAIANIGRVFAEIRLVGVYKIRVQVSSGSGDMQSEQRSFPIIVGKHSRSSD